MSAPALQRQGSAILAHIVRLMLLLLACSFAASAAVPVPAANSANPELIIVAVADKPEPISTTGSTPRGYAGVQNYAGSQRAIATAANVAHDYHLREVSAWTIEPLRLRCMLYQLPATADREAVFARLRKDQRVRLVQSQQSFDTYTSPPAATAGSAQPGVKPTTYNDPYFGLQHGFVAIGAGEAQHWSSGAGIRVALIDTGVDATHLDLAGRVDAQRDFVANSVDAPNSDRHGTEVAGVIAAVANNGLGIAGVAPDAHILSYRACWPVQPNTSAARCDTFTLAQALAAAIASGAPVINLSLGGPSDPLLEELLTYAVGHGVIVVSAVPPDGRMDGFPIDVPGVIAVSSVGDPRPQGSAALAAPGHDILTLEPGGHYDYASGSSLATAHVTGAIALLLALDHHLDAQGLFALLQKSQRGADAQINVCEAASTLGHAGGCENALAHIE